MTQETIVREHSHGGILWLDERESFLRRLRGDKEMEERRSAYARYLFDHPLGDRRRARIRFGIGG